MRKRIKDKYTRTLKYEHILLFFTKYLIIDKTYFRFKSTTLVEHQFQQYTTIFYNLRKNREKYIIVEKQKKDRLRGIRD